MNRADLLQQYESDGCIRIRQFFDPTTLANVRAEFGTLYARRCAGPAGGRPYARGRRRSRCFAAWNNTTRSSPASRGI